jgi:hypothetical protein
MGSLVANACYAGVGMKLDSGEKHRLASDRSRPDRVIGLVDHFKFGGLGVGRVCELPFATGVTSIRRSVAWMVRVELTARCRTGQGDSALTPPQKNLIPIQHNFLHVIPAIIPLMRKSQYSRALRPRTTTPSKCNLT